MTVLSSHGGEGILDDSRSIGMRRGEERRGEERRGADDNSRRKTRMERKRGGEIERDGEGWRLACSRRSD